MFIVRSACDKSAFRLCPHGKLQNTKELTSHGFLREQERSLKDIQSLQGNLSSYGIFSSSPEGKRVSHSPFHTPLSFYMRSDTACEP